MHSLAGGGAGDGAELMLSNTHTLAPNLLQALAFSVSCAYANHLSPVLGSQEASPELLRTEEVCLQAPRSVCKTIRTFVFP